MGSSSSNCRNASVNPYRVQNAGRFSSNNQETLTKPQTNPKLGSQPSSLGVNSDAVQKIIPAVTKVDLNIAANSKAHQTSTFDICRTVVNPKLVVRRGQSFTVVVELSQELDEASQDLRITFETGKQPLVSKGTQVIFLLSSEIRPKEWGATQLSKNGNKLTLTLQTSPTCFVGKWTLIFDVIKRDAPKDKSQRYKVPDQVYILFNPWCKDDIVYMSDSDLLNEYVLNDIGKLYTGSQNNITSKPWNFGQFETCVLDVALYLLDVSKLKVEVRGNPVNVVRAISALVNSNDDDGVVVGRWSGNYADGHSPASWTGTPAILEEYWKTKEPVKYGQCWVFSAVTTSVCRALGIPTRSITNFQSAHDTDGSITIDVHHKIDGSIDNEVENDSIWNFHVWNEAWMARPDLPAGYGGWQAFDATPQETSNGVYCCGPVSVAAIKQGAVNEPYDGSFVFAEVNADRVHWRQNALGTMVVIGIDYNIVGKYISTKAANSGDREDVTNSYKAQEGSPEERAAVLRANQLASNRKDIYNLPTTDVEFSLLADTKETFIGGNFDLTLKMKNSGNSTRTIGGKMEVKTMFYTGVLADLVKSENVSLKLDPGQELSFPVHIFASDYESKLKDSCMLDVAVMLFVEESDQIFVKKDTYRLRKPHLVIQGPTESKLGQELKVDVSFTNPLSKALTKTYLMIDGVVQAKRLEMSKVPANGVFQSTVSVTPNKVGKKELIVVFNSRELEDVNGSLPILINSS
nr:hemocyte protein-glutamine gamma-glutamyltransferase-like isoform X2 [Biomphalaria glabrata]